LTAPEPAAPAAPPVVIHVPHTSKVVPPDLSPPFLLKPAGLERELLAMTDHYTDELFALPAEQALCVRYPVSRLVVDPERFEDDEKEAMASRGMGAVHVRTSDGRALRAEPTPAEREALLDRFYRPHHAALEAAVRTALAANEYCFVLDGHSFPSRPLPYELDQAPDRPTICLGTDSFHTPAWLRDRAAERFAARGWSVAIDRPFCGALVPSAFHGGDGRVMALMVEVNRSAYMNEKSGKKLRGFDAFATQLRAVLAEIAEA
jgi:N-formylglutamate deformylase